ncbi:MAG: bifunctional 3-deoxy-7-phosphoheptulonate synthase/chorismate mutase type II [Bacteroidales bacterium]|nr:bifunctional 3-deoxy-7-phosphoheptulonate synthase/chorismate mutase type II [Bacteroidales bacterium]
MNHPIIIAGPCAAESQEQVRQAAVELKDFRLPQTAGGRGITFFRSGAWKPRTRPGTFEGVGKEGLLWLKDIQESTGLQTCTEVASAYHAEEVLKVGLSAVWLGTRTTANPFLVEEIAKALEGTPLHIFVKNPINPDLNLWLGAVQRILRHHPENVYAIHRGFSDYHTGQLRNAPLWRVPIEFKVQMPDIPLLCDPSHLSGHTDFIPDLAQRALDLNFDGLMLEVHHHPSQALCDGPQQLTPKTFKSLMHTLSWRKSLPSEDPLAEEKILIDAIRTRIDVLDDDLVNVLAKRMELVDHIGEVKKRGKIGIVQIERWNQVSDRTREQAVEKGLGEPFIEEVYKAIHQEAIKRQEKIIRNE